MFSAVTEGADVSGLKGRQCSLLGDGTAPPVDVSDKDTKCALPKAGSNKLWLSESLAVLGTIRDAGPVEAAMNRLPEIQPLRSSRVVGLERNNILRPAHRQGNPVGFLEKERLSQNAATDDEVTSISWIDPTIASNAGSHLLCRP